MLYASYYTSTTLLMHVNGYLLMASRNLLNRLNGKSGSLSSLKNSLRDPARTCISQFGSSKLYLSAASKVHDGYLFTQNKNTYHGLTRTTD